MHNNYAWIVIVSRLSAVCDWELPSSFDDNDNHNNNGVDNNSGVSMDDNVGKGALFLFVDFLLVCLGYFRGLMPLRVSVEGLSYL